MRGPFTPGRILKEMKSGKKLLVCVIGPTAIGKTTTAIELARAFNTEVVSADSRQFFKEMSVGTAVPTEKELAAAKHHFIHNKSIFNEYSVGDFERDALATLSILFEKHDVVILAGGSGLYVDVVVNGLDDFPEADPSIRAALKQELKENGIEALQQQLKKVDPTSYGTIDLQNKQRLIRALEIYRASGKPYSTFKNSKAAERPFQTVYIGLTAARDLIYDRINKRVDLMISGGLIEEARRLFEYRDLNALQTVGYKELFRWMENKLSREEAISEIKKNTRRFAKRQLTWYRKNKEVKWFEFDAETSEIISYIKEKKGHS